jgi:hypothetical protein
MVLANADVQTRSLLCAALADENIASEHVLTAIFLHTEALAVAVATVLD